MVNRGIWQFGIVGLLVGLLASPALAAGQLTLSGQVTYRERMALPANAELTVTLVTLGGARHTIGATAPISGAGQVPLQFVLDIRSDAIGAEQAYGLIAEIRARGVALFRNRQPVRVDPQDPQPVMIIVNFDPPDVAVEPEPAAISGELEVTANLFDTIWAVRTIAGEEVLEATKVSLSIAPDRRAGGNGGCNNYFTEAMFDGPALRFGPIAGTRMACDADVMVQEAAFFAALSATASYELGAASLSLIDANGNRVVQLDRQ